MKSIDELSQKHNLLNEKFDSFEVKTVANTEKFSLKIKILWGVGIFIVTSLVSLVIRVFS